MTEKNIDWDIKNQTKQPKHHAPLFPCFQSKFKFTIFICVFGQYEKLNLKLINVSVENVKQTVLM